MSRFFLPRHHKTHERGGSDEIRSISGVGDSLFLWFSGGTIAQQFATGVTQSVRFFTIGNDASSESIVMVPSLFEINSSGGFPDSVTILEEGVYQITGALEWAVTNISDTRRTVALGMTWTSADSRGQLSRDERSRVLDTCHVVAGVFAVTAADATTGNNEVVLAATQNNGGLDMTPDFGYLTITRVGMRFP